MIYALLTLGLLNLVASIGVLLCLSDEKKVHPMWKHWAPSKSNQMAQSISLEDELKDISL
jgi:hypothetical protein